MSRRQKVKKKVCKNCGSEYKPTKQMQSVCSPLCAINLVNKRHSNKIKKDFNKKTKQLKESIKTKSDWIKETQTNFNKFIRFRDWYEPCISCGNDDLTTHLTGGSWDCGHYRSIGSAPELRFEELNAHKQCKKCNRDLSGNHVNYRNRLKGKIGVEKLEWLEGPHDQVKWTIEQLKEKKLYYADRARELKAKIKQMEEI